MAGREQGLDRESFERDGFAVADGTDRRAVRPFLFLERKIDRGFVEGGVNLVGGRVVVVVVRVEDGFDLEMVPGDQLGDAGILDPRVDEDRLPGRPAEHDVTVLVEGR